MVSLVALADRTTAVPLVPRLSSRRSPFLTTAMLTYIAYANCPHHRPPATRTASTIPTACGIAWMAMIPAATGPKARHITPKMIQQVADILPTVTTDCLPGRGTGAGGLPGNGAIGGCWARAYGRFPGSRTEFRPAPSGPVSQPRVCLAGASH